MSLLVSDANVLIDLDVGGILNEFFALDADIIVPDALFEDELRDEHDNWLELGLQKRSVPGAAMRRVVELDGLYAEPSRYDLMALSLAEELSCTLLTGDQPLRQAANEENVEVHGTLWVGERLVDESLLRPLALRKAYVRMKRGERYLPWDMVREQLLDMDVQLDEEFEP
jgi:predicted nucleic acid-binding protein